MTGNFFFLQMFATLEIPHEIQICIKKMKNWFYQWKIDFINKTKTSNDIYRCDVYASHGFYRLVILPMWSMRLSLWTKHSLLLSFLGYRHNYFTKIILIDSKFTLRIVIFFRNSAHSKTHIKNNKGFKFMIFFHSKPKRLADVQKHTIFKNQNQKDLMFLMKFVFQCNSMEFCCL